MYTRITRSGGRSYLQLVEGYRVDGKVRQRVVASLGRLDELTEAKLPPLISGLERALGRTRQAEPIEYRSARAFGDLHALQMLWNELGLGAALSRALRSSRRSFDAEALIRTMVFNRLSCPDSKLGVLRWLETVEMPGVPAEVTHQQLLRAMDCLIDRIDAVESAVLKLVRPLLDNEVTLLFYDLTTIRIHGESNGGVQDVRAFGRSKETHGPARQFVLGVVQSAEGLPLLHTVAPGNVAEVDTLRPMLEHALKRFPVGRLVVVADRGLLSLDNVEEIRRLCGEAEQRLDIILAVPARRYGDMPEIVRSLTFKDGLAEGRFADYRLVAAHDPARAAEQTARRRTRIEAVEAFGEQLAAKLDGQDTGAASRGRRASDRGAYNRFLRRLLEEQLTRFIKTDLGAERFAFERDDKALADAEVLDGTLVLLTSIDAAAMSTARIVERYKALADIERGFRVLKSDIDIAPVHHRLPERIRAHALICFLALLLHRLLRLRLKATGSAFSPQRALATLRQIQRHRIHIGETEHSGISRPTEEQLQLFEELKLPPPR